MIEPREYQKEALKKVLKKYKSGITRQLVSLPTGTGKTILFGLVAEKLRTNTLILAHREELLYQAKSKLKLIYPDADIGILKAQEKSGLNSEICIASVQTAIRHIPELISRKYNLLICDEAHHAVSKSYKKIFSSLGFMNDDENKLLLGVTATAFRGDNTGLGEVFQEIVFERSIAAMMKAGYLCDIRCLEVNTGEDISCVHLQTGDFAVNELAQLIDIPERNNLVADTYIEHGENRRGVVFGVKVEHALNLAQAFKERGISCEAVYGEMPNDQRKDILSRYEKKEIQVLCNVGVLTEGWDVPDTDIIMMARPTKSKGLYVQCVGRGLRISPGKKDCLLIDFVDIAKRHKLCNAGTLAGKDKFKIPRNLTLLEAIEYEERERNPDYQEPEYEEIDILGRSLYVWKALGENYVLSLGNQKLYCKHDNGGYIPLVSLQSGTVGLLSDEILPIGYAMGVCEDYARNMKADNFVLKDAEWRREPATEKQIKTLLKLGITFQEGITKGEAAQKISEVMDTTATKKQIWYIKTHKLHSFPELLTKREAMQIISNYKENT